MALFQVASGEAADGVPSRPALVCRVRGECLEDVAGGLGEGSLARWVWPAIVTQICWVRRRVWTILRMLRPGTVCR